MPLLDIFTEKDINKLLFLPNIGISNNLVNSYNDFINDQAKVLFQLLDSTDLDYYVFAGSSIGLVRTGNNIPWVDDYDIIIFEDNINYFENKVYNLIKKNKFTIRPYMARGVIGGYQIYSNKKNFYKNLQGQISKFQCDVFFTYVDKNNFIKNYAGWGLYDKKNININLVKPKTYKIFNGIKLPFFKDYQKDVLLEYGDVINNCVININHGRKTIKINNVNFNNIYNDYDLIKKKAMLNSIDLIENTTYNILDDDINNLNNDLLKSNNYLINFYIISFIKKKKLDSIIIKKNSLMIYVYNIRYYCPDIKIIVDIPNYDYDYLFNLNYINQFHYESDKDLKILNNKNIFWLNKPMLISKNPKIIEDKIKVDNKIINDKDYDIFQNLLPSPIKINKQKKHSSK